MVVRGGMTSTFGPVSGPISCGRPPMGQWISTPPVGRRWGRGSRLKPAAHDGRAGGVEVELRAGEGADQRWPPADGAVDLDPAGRQVPLHVRICAGAVDPDSPHDARQSRYGRTFHV